MYIQFLDDYPRFFINKMKRKKKREARDEPQAPCETKPS